MPSKPIFTNAQLEAASYSDLTAKPSSALAVSLCGSQLANILHQQAGRPRKAQVAAFGAMIADLLERDPDDNGGWLFRSISSGSFTGLGVGYRPFITLFDLMNPMMLDVAMGTKQWLQNEATGGKRSPAWQRATRFRANDWLRRWFAEGGITRENWAEHFSRERKVVRPKQPPILLRKTKSPHSLGSSNGLPMDIGSKDSAVAELVARMERINDYLGEQVVEPFGPVFLRRIFSNGDQPDFAWDQGGRMYASGRENYQTAKKAVRATITINGQATTEVDLQGSHLTMLVGLGHVPRAVLDGDPYFIDGLPREVVKHWVNMTIGHGKRHTRWPPQAVQDFREKQGIDLPSEYPLMALGDAILKKLPILDSEGQSTLAGWGELQFRESEILLSAMETLAYEHDVPALPVHDSLIVPELKGSLAISVLKQAFHASVGIEPSVS